MFKIAWLASRQYVKPPPQPQYWLRMSTMSVPLPNSLSVKPNETIVPWDVSLQAFATFVKEHGHCNVTPSVESQRHLHQWIQLQRYHYYLREIGKPTNDSAYLTLGRIEALNHLGMDWTRLETAWEDRLQELKKYIQQNGHMKVTKTEDPELLDWIFNQRWTFKEMSNERRQKLNSIGFDWGNSKLEPWMDKYNQLVDFYTLHKHTIIPLKDESYIALSTWANEQRSQYAKLKEGKRNSIKKGQIDHLNKLNFEWCVQEYMWTKKCMELDDYVKTYRKWPSSRTNDHALIAWLSRQLKFQRAKKKGAKTTLTDDREARLDAACDRFARPSHS